MTIVEWDRGVQSVQSVSPVWGGPAPWTRRRAVLMLSAALAAGAGGVAFARTDRQPEPGITRGPGLWTSTGTIAVTGTARDLRAPAHGSAAHAQGSPLATAAAGDPESHDVWPAVVTVELALHNGLARPLLISPGQLRLRAGGDGPTVAPLAAGFRTGPQAAGSTLRSWVSYLAPGDNRVLTLEYDDQGAPALSLTLPAVTGPATLASREALDEHGAHQ